LTANGLDDKIAPRVGAAYDVKGDGRLKLYGSWGRYFDWTKYELPRDSFGADWRPFIAGARGIEFDGPISQVCSDALLASLHRPFLQLPSLSG